VRSVLRIAVDRTKRHAEIVGLFRRIGHASYQNPVKRFSPRLLAVSDGRLFGAAAFPPFAAEARKSKNPLEALEHAKPLLNASAFAVTAFPAESF